VPAIAAARAAVRDSTSSVVSINSKPQLGKLGGRRLTYQNHNEAVPILNHLHYAPEESLNKLPGL